MEWDIDHEALQVPPINITVAIVSPQKETFIADVLPGSATSATWDLVNMTRPLMVGHFTVSIYDQRGPTAIPSPGQLMPDSRLTLALYNTETYVAPTDGKIDGKSCSVGQPGQNKLSSNFFFLALAFLAAKFCPTCLLSSGTHMDYQAYFIVIGISAFTVIFFFGFT